MGVLEKTILGGNQREILCLALATLKSWSLGAASICRVLRLTTSELEDVMHPSSDIDGLYRVTMKQVERSKLVLELCIVINATFENPSNRNKFIHWLNPTFGGRTPLDILENDDPGALRRAVYQLGSQSRWPW
ncbi:hypothetical protein [Halopseudomonas aestusnigri]|uniref:hypothetical protein n=1 Tax=Halopseudomonas aestusnigri TaxID=857252 RepID=UPI001124CBF7|nr:hypothetical protein [Halopseudomonas aestusnigri]